MPRRDEKNPLAAAVGSRIRELRAERGLTAERLAYEAGRAKGFVSDIENGRALPTLETLQLLADCLDVEIVDLVTFPGASVRHAVINTTRGMAQERLQAILDTKAS